jgi:hypothetical protein
MTITEADEAANNSKELALLNLTEQVAKGETMGVISMYEVAALELGATLAETEAAIANGRERDESSAQIDVQENL